jgi:hypothetical protein
LAKEGNNLKLIAGIAILMVVIAAGTSYIFMNYFVNSDVIIDGLAKNQYRWEFEYDISRVGGEDGKHNIDFEGHTSYGDLIVDSGEVMWIVIEGGAD